METMSVHTLLTFSVIWLLVRQGLGQLLDEECRPRQKDMIIGGTDSNRAPYMAFITRNQEHICGGSLISHRFVLTAQHCFFFRGFYSVKLGVHNTSDPQMEQEFGIENLIYNNDTDLALLKLDREVKYDEHIRPICIIMGPEEILLKLNLVDDFITTGWGRNSNENPLQRPWILQTAELNRMNWSDCGRPPGYVCAKASKQFACDGDSGGPLNVYIKYKNETVNALVGVVHGGETNRCNTFSKYVNVVQFTSWIVGIVAQHNKTLLRQC